MDKLTFKEFTKNESYILAVGEEQKAIRKAWLERHNYMYLNSRHINNELKCHDGSRITVIELNAGMHSSHMKIYSVYQLEEVKAKEMTVAEISKVLGYEVKVVK